MDAGDLRLFETVARLGSMNRAAAELCTVQSNVTARLRQLEDGLGTALFERHSRGVTLTPAGERLLPYALQIRHLLADARKAVREDGVPRGTLTIGSLETTAAVRLSPLLSDFARLYPEVDLVLRTGTTAEMIEGVLQHDLEGAFVCGPVNHPDLAEETLYSERLVLLSAPGERDLDALLGRAGLRIVVIRAGCSYRQKLENLLARRGVVGLRMLEFGTLEAIVASVAAGLGVTLLPRSMIGQVWREGTVAVHELPEAETRVETCFIRRHDGFISGALTAFLETSRPVRLAAE